MDSHQGELAEPASPTEQFMDCSDILCLNIFVFLEFEAAIDDIPIFSLVQDSFFTIPRLTSIMVRDNKGVKRWKQVEVELEDHITIPELFSPGMSIESCTECFNEYASRIAMEQLPRSKPLWQVHVVKSPINTLVFKFHHSFGDGYTLMGFLLSTLKRADDPSLPLTFPSLKSSKNTVVHQSSLQRIPSFISSVFYSVTEFARSLLRATLVEDDVTPIRSRNIGIEFRPAAIFNITFSLEHIKEIKSKLGVTVNDVITGMIFYGIRLYMQDIDNESRTKGSTILTNLSTRDAESYKTTHDMHKSRGKGSLGIQVMPSYLPIPKLKDALISNPLQFVREAHRRMNQKKRSLLAAGLLNKLQQITYWCKGPEAVAKLFHRSNRNSSLTMSNIIGPADQIAFGNYPIKGLYFTVSGHPQSLVMTIISYNGKLTVTTRSENGFIDHQKLASHMNNAFEMIRKAAMEIPSN